MHLPGRRVRAHPRSRGEHVLILYLYILEQGSSPLARGTRLPAVVCPGLAGLIPARAGNTHRERPRWPTVRAHPRSRGEHRRKIQPMLRGMGSSPLARGTLQYGGIVANRHGLIPARAGNTVVLLGVVHRSGAHPRSRGEHCLHILTGYRHGGSSPLARGTRGVRLQGHRR